MGYDRGGVRIDHVDLSRPPPPLPFRGPPPLPERPPPRGPQDDFHRDMERHDRGGGLLRPPNWDRPDRDRLVFI